MTEKEAAKAAPTMHKKGYFETISVAGLIALLLYLVSAILVVIAITTDPVRIPRTLPYSGVTYNTYDNSAQIFNFMAAGSVLLTAIFFSCIDIIIRTLRDIRDRLPPRH
ncbi:hypothetical protein [Paracoccus sp. (in: a-proteobacteria)]|uniref:hypothetical protein n=1 Tax=Paracoccus sp. TaxID=267 RepID=UPI0026E0CA5F|nr:hypothetical protein [Paracoccus sp. (in: a-proteobacteria)]MDO5648907.1 hypothetical protein [Paracoccus sp. (in: a-proteobacteria)]